MATPTQPERRLLAAGFRKGSAWGTAVALGAAYGVLVESDGGLGRKQAYLPAKEADTPFVMEGDLGPIQAVDFSPPFAMRYDPGMIGTMIALLFGTAGTPAQQAATTAYKHTLQMADSVYGKFGTFAVERPAKIHEVASVKVMGLDIAMANGIIKGTLKCRGNTLIDTSAVNTLTQMDAITYQDRGNRVKFTEAAVKMNAQSGGAVTGETALELNNLAISINRKFDAPNVGGSASIIEPVENDHPEITVKLDFPRMDATSAALLATLIAETEQKMLIAFTSANEAGTGYVYSFNLSFPSLRIVDVVYPLNEVVPSSMTLQAEDAASNPTGMSYARVYAEIINKQTTDYLT